jgi:acetyl-CoA synthetase
MEAIGREDFMENARKDFMDIINALLALYGAPDASAANLLCDRHDPNQVAYRLIASDLTSTDLTYGELRRESERVAAGFRALGLRPGDRIATLMGKSRAYLATVMAIWRLGAVHVPLFTAFAPPAIAYRLKLSGAALVVCDAAQRPKLVASDAIPESAPWLVVTTGPLRPGDTGFDFLAGCPDVPPTAAKLGGEAPIIQLYTSGTTGAPKGVLVPLRALAAFEVYARYGLGLVAEDIFWNAADPGWAYGLYYGVLTTFATGVKSVIVEGGFAAESTLAILEQFKVTNFTAAPTVYRALRSAGLRPSQPLSLRCASSAGEPLTPDVNEWATNALGVQVHDHYGQTETGMLINNHHHPALKQPIKTGSMGCPLPGWTAAILNIEVDELAAPGEIGRVAIDIEASPLAWFAGYVGSTSCRELTT